MDIRRCTVDEVEASGIAAEYATHHINGLTPDPQWDTYRELEASGVVVLIGAFIDGYLVGVTVLLPYVSPHYGKLLVTNESLFVRKKYRSTGAGVYLLRAIKQYAREIGAAGVLYSAPSGGALDMVMRSKGAAPAYTSYFEAIA